MPRPAAWCDPLEPRRLMAFADPIRVFGTNGYAGAGIKFDGPPLLEQADGRIVARVDRTTPSSPYGENLDLVRFKPNGAIDRTFGKNGYVDPGYATVALLQAPGGKLIGVYPWGTRSGGRVQQGIGAYRLNADGSPDPTYGDRGRAQVAFPATDERTTASAISQAAVGADGSVYVGSGFELAQYLNNGETGAPVSLVKLTPTGTLDTAWASKGFADIPIDIRNPNKRSVIRSIDSLIVREDGTVLLAGTQETHGPDTATGTDVLGRAAYVSRLRPGGTPDPAFGAGGTYLISDPQTGYAVFPRTSLVRNPDESLVMIFRALGRTQYFELSAKGRRRSRLREDGPFEPDVVNARHLRLADGRLLRVTQDGWAEVRRTDDGRWDVRPQIQPFASDGKPTAYPPAPLVLRDGTLLTTLGTAGSLGKFSPGDGTDVRQDFIPGGQQHVIVSGESNELDVFFYDAANRSLGYRRRDAGGRWGRVETVDNAPDAGLYLSADTGGLFRDSVSPDNDRPAVAYTDGGRGDLKFAVRNTTGTWNVETVDAAGSTGLYPSLVRYGDGFAVAYYDKTRGDLKLARRSGAGKWTIETVDRVGDVGRMPKLVVKAHNGLLAIAYAVDGTNAVRLAEAGIGPKPWAFQSVAATTGGVGAIDLEYEDFDYEFGPFGDASLAAAVAFYDAGPADLVIARRPGLGDAFTPYRVAGRGTVGLSPDVQSSGDFATLFYDRTKDRVLAGHVGVPVDATAPVASVEPYVVLQPAGKFLTSTNRNGSRYELVFGWYDAAAGGLQIRDAGWYQ